MHGTWIVCVSAVVALVAASRASAMPPMPVGGVPTFVKDCKACSPEDFCEISYPGTPEGQVACVSYAQGNRHGLYRLRCAYTGTGCDTGNGVSSTAGAAGALGICVPDDNGDPCCIDKDFLTGLKACTLCTTTQSDIALFTNTDPLKCNAVTGCIGAGEAGVCEETPVIGYAAGCCTGGT
ncbi:hypothetical protein DFJ74DRAFT_710397 [Hyaloraphidium curvatum]|nr:hypothetical protein DFJ74DRAFT_710397 [Hyaloraphidium curvatum]